MNKVIIVGAGDTGQAVKHRIKNSVLVDADPGKVIMLSREHPDWKIIGGDASDPNVLKTAGLENTEYLLITTNKDYFAQKIAMTAKKVNDDIKMISVLHDIKNFHDLREAGIEHLISPISETIDAILGQLIPVGENITEIAITQHSIALGKTIMDVELPQDTIIGAVLRGHHLIRPEANTILQKGDVISLVSLGHLEADVVDAISGDHKTVVPLDNFLCLLKDENDLMILDEVLHLASRSVAKCRFIFPESLISSRELIEKKAKDHGVEITCESYMGNILEKFASQARELDATTSNPLIILPQRKLSLLKYHLPAKFLENLIIEIPFPFYIPKSMQYKKFDRVLHFITDQHHDGLCASCAVGMARVNDVPIKSLVLHNPENTYAEEILIHTKRIAKVYGIDVVEEVIEGNPTLEFIQDVRSTANQLVIINWECSTLRRDIMRKIINEANASVLLMK